LNLILSNWRRLKYADEAKALRFVDTLKQSSGSGTLKEMISRIDQVLKDSSCFWNYYYNLLAIQRSWLYLIFKYICGTSDDMKGEHYEDFTTVLRYFNLKDLAVQRALQAYKSTGDDLMKIDVKSMTEEERDAFVTKAVNSNPDIGQKKSIELLSTDVPQEWNLELLRGLDVFQQIQRKKLNSTFGLRFPQEKDQIEYILANFCTPVNEFDRMVLNCLFTFLKKITKRLLDAHALRNQVLASLKQQFALISDRLNGEELYYLTARELHKFGQKLDVNLLNLAAKRKEAFSALKMGRTEEIEEQITLYPVVYGTCVGSGSVTGEAVVMDEPDVEFFMKKAENEEKMILVTSRLSKHFVWLPCLRLFDGIVLEASGYFDTDAAICRLVGVPCIIGAKNATKLFKTGDNVVLNGTKGQLKKQIVSAAIQEGL